MNTPPEVPKHPLDPEMLRQALGPMALIKSIEYYENGSIKKVEYER